MPIPSGGRPAAARPSVTYDTMAKKGRLTTKLERAKTRGQRERSLEPRSGLKICQAAELVAGVAAEVVEGGVEMLRRREVSMRATRRPCQVSQFSIHFNLFLTASFSP